MNELGMSNLDVADVDAVATVVKEEAQASTLKEAKVGTLPGCNHRANLNYDACMARVRKNQKTLSKNEADKRRGNAYVGTRKAIDSLTYSPDETIRTKATVVRHHGHVRFGGREVRRV